MRADKLVDSLAEHEIADLRAHIDAFGLLACHGVPEANCAVCCAAA